MAFDATMSMAILSALPPEDTCVSLEIKTSTPGGAQSGEPLRLSGRVIRLGKTVIFAEASAIRDGELIATSSGTFLRRSKTRLKQ
jgi:acyl-coenzyme A thioesterase PaaI-like protein